MSTTSNIYRVALLPRDLDISQAEFVKLPCPKTGLSTHYAWFPSKLSDAAGNLYRIYNALPNSLASWLSSDLCLQDGSLYAFLPIDPVFIELFLAMLIKKHYELYGEEPLEQKNLLLAEWVSTFSKLSPSNQHDPAELTLDIVHDKFKRLIQGYAQNIPLDRLSRRSYDLHFTPNAPVKDIRLLSALEYYKDLLDPSTFGAICRDFNLEQTSNASSQLSREPETATPSPLLKTKKPRKDAPASAAKGTACITSFFPVKKKPDCDVVRS